MATISHSLDIEAQAERVWGLTLDVERWPTFFPTVTSVVRADEGPMRVGSAARIKQPGQPVRRWTVTECEAPRRFTWETTGLGLSMRAMHVITPSGRGRVTNTLTIEIDGPLGRVLGALVRSRIQDVLRLENEGFRAVAESAVSDDARTIPA